MTRFGASNLRATIMTFAVALLCASQALAQTSSNSRPPFGNAPNQGGANARANEPRMPLLQSLFGGGSTQRNVNAERERAANEQRQRALAQRQGSNFGAQSSQDFHARAQHLGTANPQNLPSSFGGARTTAPPLGGEALSQASSSAQEAREALANVPWDLMPPATREKLRQLSSTPTIYRRLPMAGGRCNPELFDFFLTYPNAVVELWKQMGYDEIEMTPQGPGRYAIREKNGSNGIAQVIYQDKELAVVYASGNYRGAGLVRPVEGEALVVLRSRYTEDDARTPLVICRLDAFIAIKNPGVDFLARAFNAAIGKIADANFEQTLAFIDSVSQTAEQSPREFQSVVASMSGLSREAKQIFATKAREVERQARARQRGEIVEYRLLAKRNDPNPGYARILSRGVEPPTYANDRLPDAFPKSAPTEFSTSGFASSGFASSGAAKTPIEKNSFAPFSANEFSLSDDSEVVFDWDDGETTPTGEEILAGRSSLAKVGVKPSARANAIQMIDEQESKGLQSSDAFIGKKKSFVAGEPISTDENDDEPLEIYIDDDFAIGGDSDANDDESEPQPLADASSPVPLLPSLRAPVGSRASKLATTGAPQAQNAGSLDDSELYIDIQDDVASEGTEDDADAIALDDSETTDRANAQNAVESPQLAPYADFVDDDPKAEKTTKADAAPVDLGANWTRANFVTPEYVKGENPAAARPFKTTMKKIERSAKKIEKKVEKNAKELEHKIKDEIKSDERPRFVTRRYSPKASDAVTDGDSTKRSIEGEPVSTFKRAATPAPTPVVAKTAAADVEVESNAPTFKKPNMLQ